jgi:nicotinate-nucleotide pyrophosphorylase (carboxylating)
MSKSFEHLLPPSWKAQVTTWLAEDAPSFDYGGYVVGEVWREAFLLGKGQNVAILAGSPFFTEVFAQLNCEYVSIYSTYVLVDYDTNRVEWHVKEGDTFEPVKHVATVRGKARHLLLGERVALNMLARCSGIATK